MQSYFQTDLTLVRSWFINGKNYSRTLEDWLKLQDRNRKHGLDVLETDAVARGLRKEEGRKTFYRYVYIQCFAKPLYMTHTDWRTFGFD